MTPPSAGGLTSLYSVKTSTWWTLRCIEPQITEKRLELLPVVRWVLAYHQPLFRCIDVKSPITQSIIFAQSGLCGRFLKIITIQPGTSGVLPSNLSGLLRVKLNQLLFLSKKLALVWFCLMHNAVFWNYKSYAPVWHIVFLFCALSKTKKKAIKCLWTVWIYHVRRIGADVILYHRSLPTFWQVKISVGTISRKSTLTFPAQNRLTSICPRLGLNTSLGFPKNPPAGNYITH